MHSSKQKVALLASTAQIREVLRTLMLAVIEVSGRRYAELLDIVCAWV